MWTALSLIVAAGVAYATVVLLRLPKLPRTARWIAAGLGAYGTIAFLHGVLTGTPLPSLLAGQGFWRMLPYALRGAVVGGLVVLPLALLVSVVRAGLRAPVPGSRARAIRETAALAAALATVVAALPRRGFPVVAVSETAASGLAATVEISASPERLAALENSFRAIEDGERESPRDRWDPEYLVDQLGRDPEAIFDWVRNNTEWIPYRGVLRGPAGVLMDRQGNSLDRALLLATMLHKAGHSVRLAHSGLTRHEAFEALSGLFASRTKSPPPIEADDQAEFDLRSVAAQYRLETTEIERTLDAQAEGMTEIPSEVDERVSDQTDRLLTLIDRPDADVELEGRFEDVLRSLEDHWWVQRLDGGNWRDIDLLTTSGRTFVPMRESLNLDSLPPEIHHEIAVRVVVEQLSGNALTERRALEHVLRPATLVGRPIVLQFWPTHWPAANPSAASPQAAFRATALEQSEWTVALLIGRDVVADAILQDTGDVGQSPPANPFAGLGAGMANALRKGAPDPSQSKRNKELSAAWIEYEVRVPDRQPRTIRRVVFDTLGGEARATNRVSEVARDAPRKLGRSLSLMMRTEILPVSCKVAPEFIAHLAGQSLLGNRNLVRTIARNEFAPGTIATEKLLTEAAPPVSPLYSLALARWEWSRSADDIFVDRPGILTRHRFPEAVADGIAVRDATDIVSSEVGVSLTAPDPFAVRLEQGVLDTNAEAYVRYGVPIAGNTAEAFTLAGEWVTVTSARRDVLARLRLPPDVRRGIIHDLDGGYTVVVPAEAVASGGEAFLGWWRIDSATGDTLGVAANGWGQVVDRAILADIFVMMAKSFAFEYVLCHAFPQAANLLTMLGGELRARGLSPSWTRPNPRAADPEELFDANQRVCLIGAILMGFVATAPLLLLSLRFTSRAPLGWVGPGTRWLHPTLRSRYSRTGTSPKPKGDPRPRVGTPPGERPPGDTLPGVDRAKTEPDLGRAKTEPDLGRAKTERDLGRARTERDLGRAKTEPRVPHAKTDPQPPGPPRPPLTVDEARDRLSKAAAANDAAFEQSWEATGQWARNRANKPNPGRGHEGDPSKWDPALDQKLRAEADAQRRASDKAFNEWRQAQQDLADAIKREKRWKGPGAPPSPGGGPGGAPPAPKFPGCPPNCGNSNPTGPAGVVGGRNKTLIGLGGILGGQ